MLDPNIGNVTSWHCNCSEVPNKFTHVLCIITSHRIWIDIISRHFRSDGMHAPHSSYQKWIAHFPVQIIRILSANAASACTIVCRRTQIQRQRRRIRMQMCHVNINVCKPNGRAASTAATLSPWRAFFPLWKLFVFTHVFLDACVHVFRKTYMLEHGTSWDWWRNCVRTPTGEVTYIWIHFRSVWSQLGRLLGLRLIAAGARHTHQQIHCVQSVIVSVPFGWSAAAAAATLEAVKRFRANGWRVWFHDRHRRLDGCV